ncbi:MAG TPA: zinc ribbon domain-containing protein [Pyrinomonadaceae bacterium]|jgi:hypothetical protein
MYCPQCGQQQISGDTRFCSRCGFPLSGVLALLASGGVPAVSPMGASPKMLSPRRRGYRQGAMMMIICFLITPLMAILTEVGLPEILVPLSAVIFFWGGVIRMIYARMFEDATPHTMPVSLPSYIPPAGAAQFGAGGARSADALPPQRSVPVTGWRQPDTAEIIAPPSVTENTTRLLDDKAEPPGR